MQLTSFSDYALRLMMYTAANEDRLVTIDEAARVYGISRAHLMKVANHLTRLDFLKAVRGRYGGLTLARPATAIRLGDVVRATEADFALVECFGADSQCLITRIAACADCSARRSRPSWRFSTATRLPISRCRRRISDCRRLPGQALIGLQRTAEPNNDSLPIISGVHGGS